MNWICSKCETYHEGAEDTCEVCGHAKPAKRLVATRKISTRPRPKARSTPDFREITSTRPTTVRGPTVVRYSSRGMSYSSPSVTVSPVSPLSNLHLQIIGLCIVALAIVAYLFCRTEAQIEKVWVSNSLLGVEHGAIIHTRFNCSNLKNKPSEVAVFFYDHSGTPISSSTPGFLTTSNTLCVAGDFNSRYRFSKFDDFELFIPYKTFDNLNPSKHAGTNKVDMIVGVWQKGEYGPNSALALSYQSFDLTWR